MNNKIPLRCLAENVADRTGENVDKSLSFVKSLFLIISNKLLDGEAVSLGGFGEFSVTQNPEEPVRFNVDRDFADELNAPFAMFNSVEIPKGVSSTELFEAIQDFFDENHESPNTENKEDELLSEKDINTEVKLTKPQEEPQPEAVIFDLGSNEEACSEINTPVESNTSDVIIDVPITTDESIADDKQICEEEIKENIEIYSEPSPIVDSSIIPTDEEEYYEDNDEEIHKSRFGLGFVLGLTVGLIIGALAFVGYILYFVETGTKLF